MVKKFSAFKPTFSASELYKFCAPNVCDKVAFNFLIRHSPFAKEYRQKRPQNEWAAKMDVTQPKPASDPFKLGIEVKDEWKRNFINGNLNFDDGKVFNKVLSNYFQKMNSDSNEEKATPDLNLGKLYGLMRSVRLERGNQLQNLVIEKVNQEEKTNFTCNNKVFMIEFENFFLKGRPDGVDQSSQSVIEIKSKSRSLHRINSDRIQCMAYLKLTNAEKCFLVMAEPNSAHSILKFKFVPEEFESQVVAKIDHFVHKCRNLSPSDFLKMIKKFSKNGTRL